VTDDLEIAERPVPGWFFMRRDAPLATLAPLVGNEAWWPCVSRQKTDSTILAAAEHLIDGARRRILLASFRIGHESLLRKLLDAAERLEGGVYVLSALDPKSLAKGSALLDDDTPPDKATLQKDFAPFAARGMCVRGHPSCHAKFLVADDDAALVSTANLETSAFERTTEVGVVVRDRVEVDRLARFYTRLWYAAPWEISSRRGEYTVSNRAPSASPQLVLGSDGPQSALWTHCDDGLDERHVLRVLHEVAAKARRELFLASFSLMGNTADPSLIAAPIKAALDRGVAVTLFVRGRNNVTEQRRDAGLLAELGVRVLADDRTHAKCVIADGGDHGAIFSANFDAAHGLTHGVEVGARLDGEPALRSLATFLAAEAEAGNRVLTRDPTHRALAPFLEGPSGALRREIPLEASDALWGALAGAAEMGPCLIEHQTAADTLRFTIGERVFAASAPRDGARALTFAGMASATKVLDGWLGKPPSRTRGLLTAVLRRR
jgi:hypothetical protein